MRSRTVTTPPTSTSSPVSSRTSRAVAASSVSPVSTAPPGMLHSPLSGARPRRTSSTRSPSRMTAPTPTIGRGGYSRSSAISHLLAHDLDDDALLPAAVELGVEDLLPWTEIQPAVGDRQGHLMAHDGALQVRVGVVFSGLMMAIIEAGRRQLLEPRLKVRDQAALPVVDVDAGGDVHRRHEDHSLFDAALRHDRGDVIGDANELLALLRIEPEVVGEDLHSASAASALRSRAAVVPPRNLRNPAAAIIAALSVESFTLGRKVGISRASPCAVNSARRRLFADTPPATPMLFA